MRTTAILLGSLLAASANAATFCVANGDELQAAMITAGNSAESDQIRLRNGVYERALSAPPGTDVMFRLQTSQNGAIAISGGWNTNCTVRTVAPMATILYGQNNYRVLEAIAFGQSTATISIHNLALAGGYSINSQGVALGRFALFGSAPATMEVSHVDFSGGNALNSPAVMLQITTGRISFTNNVVHSNQSSGLPIVQGSVAAGQTLDLTNNTITQNTSTQSGGVSIDGPGVLRMYNNVIWGNGGMFDFRHLAGLTVTAVANHLGTLASAIQGAQGSTTGNPMFANPAASDYRPVLTSPLRNSGDANPPAGVPALDYAGLTRKAGVRIDRGAYEFEELMGDGFE